MTLGELIPVLGAALTSGGAVAAWVTWRGRERMAALPVLDRVMERLGRIETAHDECLAALRASEHAASERLAAVQEEGRRERHRIREDFGARLAESEAALAETRGKMEVLEHLVRLTPRFPRPEGAE